MANVPWTSQQKDVSATTVQPHVSSVAGVSGRGPGVTSITFKPLEFFAAAARCSHLNVINPAIVTPESLIISSLVENHVDDTSTDFAILSTADTFKDYIKSYFAGTVAAGLAYLQMIKDGYVWSDHFEHFGGGAPGVTRTPDFVFSRPGNADVALVESKGTRSATQATFDSTVDGGYTGQVEPHLGHYVGGLLASHGFCVGAWLTSTTKAELNIHHTAGAVAGGPWGSAASGAADNDDASWTVQRQNYATAFRLAHSEALARQVRGGVLEIEPVPFVEFSWLNRRFLTSAPLGWLREKGLLFLSNPSQSNYGYSPRLSGQICDLPRPFKFMAFAIERDRAEAVLRRVSAVGRVERYEVSPIANDVLAQARREGGALFPDGLAAIELGAPTSEVHVVEWRNGAFHS
jgi:hypothetical protein